MKKEFGENIEKEDNVDKLEMLEATVKKLSYENQKMKEKLDKYWMLGEPSAIMETFQELMNKNQDLESELQDLKENLLRPGLSEKSYGVIKTILRIEKENLEELLSISKARKNINPNNNSFKKQILDIEEALRDLEKLL